MVLAEAKQGGDCEEDYVQFGRDILFITSYRSDKFCHRIQVSTVQCIRQYSAVLVSTVQCKE